VQRQIRGFPRRVTGTSGLHNGCVRDLRVSDRRWTSISAGASMPGAIWKTIRTPSTVSSCPVVVMTSVGGISETVPDTTNHTARYRITLTSMTLPLAADTSRTAIAATIDASDRPSCPSEQPQPFPSVWCPRQDSNLRPRD
jgi:hypothetical protein